MATEVLLMNLSCGPESWRKSAPPLQVLRGALELLEEPTADLERRRVLTLAVEATESLAAVDMRCFVQAEAKPVPLAVVRTMALSCQMAIGVLEQGLLMDEIHQHASDLLVRYGRAVDTALMRMKQIYAVFVAAIENFVGERAKEPLENRLARAVALARDTKPIDLGDFSQYAHEAESAG
jgi:hypothetical protein